MADRVEVGAVAAAEQVAARLWLVHLDLPQIAARSRAGQVVLVRCSDADHPTFDPYLPRAFFVFAVDRAAGRLSLLVERRGRGSAWLAGRAPGDRLLVHGPVGREVVPGRLTRHLLLLADGAVAVAGLALLAAEAAQRGLAVTLLENVASGSEGVPPSLLRADVEYRATSPDAGGLLGALPALFSWTDEVIVAAPLPLLDTMHALRRARLEPFTLYGSVAVQAVPLPQPPRPGGTAPSGGEFLPCGTGVCGVCVVPTQRGARLYCRDGPAFPLEALRFGAGAEDEEDELEAG